MHTNIPSSLGNCCDTAYKTKIMCHEEAAQGKQCGFLFFTQSKTQIAYNQAEKLGKFCMLI